ncbi:ATP-binding protein [Nocardia sp. CA-135953]|uniref:ATP-binding protein n=1 Tax=Nocardia sp. CA-135953 TaxID=3239978 RepID=UPI003D99C35F
MRVYTYPNSSDAVDVARHRIRYRGSVQGRDPQVHTHRSARDPVTLERGDGVLDRAVSSVVMSTTRGHLPGDPNAFVGREPELSRVITLMLGSTRLITLTGPGGIGKTRLATELIRRYQRANNTVVHWVRLARMARGSTRAAIEAEIAQSVIEADFSDRTAFDALTDTFSSTDIAGRGVATILVLDNCEHLVVGAAQLIADLLEAVPELTILATSRQAIGWADECLVTIPPLTQHEAVTLFRQRATLTDRARIADDKLSMVEEICRHIHNHPLYIRLAAARLRHQPLPMILGELTGQSNDRRMQWADGPRAGVDPRHQAVPDVIAWSYQLCDEQERMLLCRMSVFAAGYDVNPEERGDHYVSEVGAELRAVQSVCSDEIGADHPNILTAAEIVQVLERLVDKSLVISHIGANTVRYSLLESIRLFAQQKLREQDSTDLDECDRLAERHLRYYHQRVSEARATWFSPHERYLLDWARAEWDNILSAIEFSLTTPPLIETGLEICCGLIALRVPFFRASMREIRRLTERSLEALRTLPRYSTMLEIDALSQLVLITLCQGQHEDAERRLDRCMTICLSDLELDVDWRCRPEADLGLPAPAEFAWGAELLLAQRDPRAIAVLERARNKCDAVGEHGGSAMSEMFGAMSAALLGTSEQAYAQARAFRDRSAESGALWMRSWGEMVWAIALTKHGRPSEALGFERTALEHQLPTRDQWGALWVVEFKVWTLAQMISDGMAQRNVDRKKLRPLAVETACLIGGTAALRARIGVDIDEMGPFGDETRHAMAVARRVLGTAAYSEAEARGTLLRPEHSEVQRFALGTLLIKQSQGSAPQSGIQPQWAELSMAEQDVAILAAAGWTNKNIALRRGNSAKTIDAQIASVLRKLLLRSRVDIVRFVPDDLMEAVWIEADRRPNRSGARGPRRGSAATGPTSSNAPSRS